MWFLLFGSTLLFKITSIIKITKTKIIKITFRSLAILCYNYVTLYYKVKTFPVKAEKIINAYAASFFPSVCFSEKHLAKISGA